MAEGHRHGDLREDTHDQTSDSWAVDWQDRGAQRPRLGIRRLDVTASRGAVSLPAGKQFIRWGKADVLNPTDRFAPRDFLNVFDSEFLAVSGARAMSDFSRTRSISSTSRVSPRAARRCPASAGLRACRRRLASSIVDAGRVFPEGAQYGARWNHVGSGFEFSLSGYRGFNHTPSLELLPTIQVYPPVVALRQFYPQMWMAGGDAAWPLSWFTVKGEAAFFGSDDERVDE